MAVFIKGSQGDAPLVKTVFATPVLPGSKLEGTNWDELPRSLLSWQATFQPLMEQDEEMLHDQSTKSDLFQDTKAAVSFTFTSRKRAAASQDQDEFDTQGFRVKLVPLPASLGDKPTPAVQRLPNNGVWSALVANVETLQGHIVRIGDSASKHFKTTNDVLQELEYKLSVLKTLVGKRTNLFGTATAFKSLHSLTDQVKQLRTGPGLAVIPPSAVPTPPAPVPYQMKHLKGKINIIDTFLVK
ncbi:hypothetical protein ACA910_003364 [Epithemia clementina (nom. ined.)]